MTNYQLGKVYKIVCNNTGLIYIGSTCQPTLAKRLAKHKSSYKAWLNGKYGYTSSYEIIKNGNYSIILLENYACSNKDELRSKERYYIENNQCINKAIPVRSEDENNNRGKVDYEKKKEIYQQRHKQYYEENKDKLQEKKKKWTENNKEKVRQIALACYYRNKSNILEKKREKYTCLCGSDLSYSSKAYHEKTSKHCEFIDNIKNQGIMI